ncbi:hypothetical protein AgCh_039790 [Apium graveolens]
MEREREHRDRKYRERKNGIQGGFFKFKFDHLQASDNQWPAGKKLNGSEVISKKQLRDEAMSYWFFLEKELASALANDKDLLSKCLEGDEEALCSARRFLMNYGWWEKANRVVINSDASENKLYNDPKSKDTEKFLEDFIWANKELVHPNVLEMIVKGDDEGIKMALNHIHYGTLKVACDIKELKTLQLSCKDSEEVRGKSAGKNNIVKGRAIEDDFINNHKHLVDDWSLKEAKVSSVFPEHTIVEKEGHCPTFKDVQLKKKTSDNSSNVQGSKMNGTPHYPKKIERYFSNLASKRGDLLGVTKGVDCETAFKLPVLKIATFINEDLSGKIWINFEGRLMEIYCREEITGYQDWEFDEIDSDASESLLVNEDKDVTYVENEAELEESVHSEGAERKQFKGVEFNVS